MRVAIITYEYNPDGFERQINNAIKQIEEGGKKVIDIKYQMDLASVNYFFSAMIMYE